MRTPRTVPIVVALVALVVAGLVALALVAARDGAGEPRALPILGADAEHPADGSEPTVGGYHEYVLPDELPALPDEAPAYELSGDVDAAAVRELAEVLGLVGDVEPSESGWSVRGRERTLEVTSGAGGSWSYHRAASATSDVPVAGEAPAPTLSIDRGGAEARGRQLLAELGVDLDDAAVRVEDGWSGWIVSADPEVGGLPTIGFSTSVSIGPGGRVEFASGWLGPYDLIADYPLVGVRRAVAEANDREARRAEDLAGEPERWRFVVERVRLGLALSAPYEPGAPAYLVPSFLLLTEAGWEASFVAVTGELLTEAPGSEPPGDDHDHDHDEPAGTAAERCAGQASGAAPGEVPVVEELQVCGPTTAVVGQRLSFELTARGRIRDDCASPLADFLGDGSVVVCEIGCTALPAEPVEVVRTFEHVYEAPGTYQAQFVLQGCPGGEQARLAMEVRVEASP